MESNIPIKQTDSRCTFRVQQIFNRQFNAYRMCNYLPFKPTNRSNVFMFSQEGSITGIKTEYS